VLDAGGRPVAEAFVSVVEATVPVPEIALVTEADGTFQIGLPPGRFRLRATTADGRAGDVEVSGESDEEMVIRIESRKPTAKADSAES
jgi:hypothetical protein